MQICSVPVAQFPFSGTSEQILSIHVQTTSDGLHGESAVYAGSGISLSIYRTTSFSEAYLIFVSIKVWGKIFHQKNTNLVKFDLKEAIFSDFFNGI